MSLHEEIYRLFPNVSYILDKKDTSVAYDSNNVKVTLPTFVKDITGVYYSYYNLDGTVDIVKEVEALKVKKSKEMKRECKTAIKAGVVCDALAINMLYPTLQQDQANLTALVSMAMNQSNTKITYKFYCKDMANVWARRQHTAKQIVAVGKTVMSYIVTQQDKYETKLTEINAITTLNKLIAITW